MVERQYTDPVEGPNVDEHPEIEEEEDEKPKRRAPRKHVSKVEDEVTPKVPVDNPDVEHGVWMPDTPQPVVEEDWASRTDKTVTSKPDDVV